MSASRSVQVERSFGDLSGLLTLRPAGWVESFLRIAAHAGEVAGARARGVTTKPGSREIKVSLAAAIPGSDRKHLSVPFRWTTGGFTWVPPVYAGRIELRNVSTRACEISLDGSYELPGTIRGLEDADAVAIAVATTTETFLRSLRAALEEQARGLG